MFLLYPAVDIDNLAKFVLDALNGHAYKDDSQVSMLYTAKLYTEGDPCVKVQIRSLPEEIRGKYEDDLTKLL
jgi:Holliday junction resolvase RusA-like endonuclease